MKARPPFRPHRVPATKGHRIVAFAFGHAPKDIRKWERSAEGRRVLASRPSSR